MELDFDRYWLLILAAGVSAVWYAIERRRGVRGRRALFAAAMKDRALLPGAIARLRAELDELKTRGRRWAAAMSASPYAESFEPQIAETQFALAQLLLRMDRAAEALAVVEEAEAFELFDTLYGTRSQLLFESRLLLRRWNEAAETFVKYPRFIEAHVIVDARARVLLGRGDADGALAALDEALGGAAGEEPSALQLTRARTLATLGRAPETVHRLLAAQPREELETLARRHPDEPAARVARELLHAAGPYR